MPQELDWQALDAFLTYTFIPAPRTIYRAIRKVPPGTTITIGPDGEIEDAHLLVRSRIRSPWQHAGALSGSTRVDSGLQRAVQSHLVSDVPVGRVSVRGRR